MWFFPRLRGRCTPPTLNQPSIANHKWIYPILISAGDTVAEWLRRGPAKLVGSARASSILVGVGNFFIIFVVICISYVFIYLFIYFSLL